MGVGVTLLCALWPLLADPPRAARPHPAPRGRAAPARPPAVGWPRCPSRPGSPGSPSGRPARWKIGALFVGRLRRRARPPGSRPRAASSSRWRRRVRWRVARLAAGRGQPPPARQPRGRRCWSSLGLAVMLIVAIALLDRQPARPARGPQRRAQAPAFFFIDIQPDQARAVRARSWRRSGATAPAELTPVVRSRLAAVNGASIAQDERARRDEAWYLTREYVLTWAAEPPGHNTVVAGRWWTPEEAAPRAPDLGGGGDRAPARGRPRRHAHLRHPGRAGHARG